jgi:hypothetical protein
VIDRFVDFFDDGLQLSGRQVEVSSEGCLEFMEAIFEVYDVNICTLTKASSAFYLSEYIAASLRSVTKGKKIAAVRHIFFGSDKIGVCTVHLDT